ncbi:D-alanine--D-alanine ligase [Gordonibacter sp. An230]|nr:D-alanine--D-alanine ligase [Gordonibacter sp. An230]
MMKEGYMARCRVALLAGGKSGEREVSLASGEGARKALVKAGYDVTVLDPSDKEDLKLLIEGPFDVAFLCLHGKYGEDGTVQGLLETIGLPYIGSGVWASALAMDKSKSKRFYHEEGIPTPPSVTLHAQDEYNAETLANELGPRCVVKPATEGSALGVNIVEGAEAIENAIQGVFEIDDEVLVERYIQGRELTVAVIGNRELTALPIIEIVAKNDFYDYESKYAPGGSQHICPAPLPDTTTSFVQELAVRAHRALSCSGVSRSDFILESDGSCWILETNTIPGMTETSLLPDAARAAGISFSDLCTKLVCYALEK